MGVTAKNPFEDAEEYEGQDARAGEPLPVYVGVNLSAIQVARDNIADVVEEASAHTPGQQAYGGGGDRDI